MGIRGRAVIGFWHQGTGGVHTRLTSLKRGIGIVCRSPCVNRGRGRVNMTHPVRQLRFFQDATMACVVSYQYVIQSGVCACSSASTMKPSIQYACMRTTRLQVLAEIGLGEVRVVTWPSASAMAVPGPDSAR